MNDLNFEEAYKLDKRSFCQYYLYVIKKSNYHRINLNDENNNLRNSMQINCKIKKKKNVLEKKEYVL